MIDKFNREINYLRISVTDRCNLRCIYCMPSDGIFHKPQNNILSYEYINRIVRIACGLGIEKVRITGGEPLARKDLVSLIKSLRGIKGLKEIALTTNGIYLASYAHSLKQAGLDRVNISLDSLKPDKFSSITRGGNLKAVLGGIESALDAGFSMVKINTVLIKGLNEDEIIDFANLTRAMPVEVRFIEFMPTNLDYHPHGHFFFSGQEAKNICSDLGELFPVVDHKFLTARVFKIDGFSGRIGFISPLSEPFCSSCNKLRLTSDGSLRSCLHSPKSVNLKEAMDRGVMDEDLAMLIREAVTLKPKSHHLQETPIRIESEKFSMCQIGG
ncbi:MAG: GTP 3',8-cyclase MoaA [Candidatus Omnitrophica bacterium]|nr:GTP 3',8-cyclase MoaA [Candidatus Omnitrophota bacterium]